MRPSKKPNTPDTALPSRRDRLFDGARDLVDFAFDDSVAAVFPDMIRRSVPGYDTVVTLTGVIAARHLTEGGRCYDLGCSLGASTHAVLRTVGDVPCEIVAVDNAPAMLDEAARMGAGEGRVNWVQADVREVAIDNAQVVILNYVLQFVPPGDRLPLLRRIRRGLTDDGILIVSEKIAAPGYFNDLHLDFKRANGYSELEISRKRAALEQVMRIDTEDDHMTRFERAGFVDTEVWFRCLNWVSFVARGDRSPR